MEIGRCIRVLVPLAAIAVVGATGLARPTPLHAADPPWDPPPCPPGPSAAVAAPAWYSLEPRLDAAGWLTGYRLALGDLAGTGARHLALPPESFASGPVDGLVLVGDDDGSRSRLRVVDVAAGCATELGQEASVIRSAVLAAGGGAVWEHRVNRATRADEGIWRRSPLGGATVRVLEGLAPDPAYGPTFSTELRLEPDGRVAVGSCGERRCRVRVFEPRTGGVSLIAGTGPLLGIDHGRAIAWAECPGLPCAIVAIDLRTGRRVTLIDGAGPAVLAAGDGRAVVHERPDGRLELVDLETLRRTLLVTPPGSAPVRDGSAAAGGADLPAGGVLLAPAGQVVDPGELRVVEAGTGRVSRLGEVRR